MVADRQALVVVTHDKDRKRVSRLVPEGSRRRFREGAGVSFLACPEPLAARRVREKIEAIAFHDERARRAGGCLHPHITKTSLTASTATAPAAEDDDKGPDDEP